MEDRGLKFDFELKDGSFELNTGIDKKRGDLLFFMGFTYMDRKYRPEFTTGLRMIPQKTTNYVNETKVFILGNLKSRILTFVQNIFVDKMFIGIERNTRSYTIAINYGHTKDTNKEVKTLSKVI